MGGVRPFSSLKKKNKTKRSDRGSSSSLFTREEERSPHRMFRRISVQTAARAVAVANVVPASTTASTTASFRRGGGDESGSPDQPKSNVSGSLGGIFQRRQSDGDERGGTVHAARTTHLEPLHGFEHRRDRTCRRSGMGSRACTG